MAMKRNVSAGKLPVSIEEGDEADPFQSPPPSRPQRRPTGYTQGGSDGRPAVILHGGLGAAPDDAIHGGDPDADDAEESGEKSVGGRTRGPKIEYSSAGGDSMELSADQDAMQSSWPYPRSMSARPVKGRTGSQLKLSEDDSDEQLEGTFTSKLRTASRMFQGLELKIMSALQSDHNDVAMGVNGVSQDIGATRHPNLIISPASLDSPHEGVSAGVGAGAGAGPGGDHGGDMGKEPTVGAAVVPQTDMEEVDMEYGRVPKSGCLAFLFRRSKAVRDLYWDYFAKYSETGNSSTRFFFMFLYLADWMWVVSYVAEQWDIQGNESNDWYYVPRQQAYWGIKVALAYILVLESIFRLAFLGRSIARFYSFMVIAVLDVLTIWPYILSVYWVTLRTLYVPGFMRVWHSQMVLKVFVLGNSVRQRIDARTQIILVVHTLVCIVVTGACAFRFCYNTFHPRPEVPLTFLDALYFMVVTMSTVGYGDVTPDNQWSRIFVIGIIVCTLVIVPNSISRLATILRESSRFGGRYHTSPHKRHVVVCGRITYEVMTDVFVELYRRDVRRGDKRSIVVMLSTIEPSSELRALLLRPYLAKRTLFLQGSALLDRDLDRAQISKAAAVFLIADRSGDGVRGHIESAFGAGDDDGDIDVADVDKNNILRAWAIHLYAPEVPLYASILRPENRSHIERTFNCTHITCSEELKMDFLAASCIASGASTLVTNLLREQSAYYEAELASHTKLPWVEEYALGVTTNVRRLVAAGHIVGVAFADAAAAINLKFRATLIGLRARAPGASRGAIILNPGLSHTLRSGEELFICAASNRMVDDIREFIRSRECLLALSTSGEDSGGRIIENVAFVAPPSGQSVDASASAVTASPAPAGGRRSGSGGRGGSGGGGGGGRAGMMSWMERPLSDVANPHSLGLPGTPTHVDLPREPFPGARLFKCHVLPQGCATVLAAVTLKTAAHLRRHVILCSDALDGAYRFVARLRAATLPRSSLRPIVLVGPRPPSSISWEGIGQFPGVFYVRGSPTRAESLLRAGGRTADRIVIMSDPNSLATAGGEGTERALLDARAIMVAKMVRLLNDEREAPIPATTELLFPENMKFLAAAGVTNITKRRISHFFQPAYAAGHGWTSSLVDTVVYASLHEPYLNDVMHALVGPRTAADEDGAHATLVQLQLPEGAVGRTYGELFQEHARDDGIILLGLYRAASELLGNTLPYVFTNPPADVRINAGDLLFALSNISQQESSAC